MIARQSGCRALMSARFFIYIMANPSRVLCTGVTRNLFRRVHGHRLGQVPGFTDKYQLTRLVYFEEAPGAQFALDRVRQVRGWSRERKIRLVESVNAGWLDLAHDWHLRTTETLTITT